jgi:hypothetical protein
VYLRRVVRRRGCDPGRRLGIIQVIRDARAARGDAGRYAPVTNIVVPVGVIREVSIEIGRV